MNAIRLFPNPKSKFEIRKFAVLTVLLQLATCNLQPATIVGNLTDISLQPLDTRISFAPTNQVLVTGAGLSVGPPRIIQTTSGSFSIPLDAGDYTVSLPLLGWRKPFIISVPNTNGTVNITNLPVSLPFPDHPLSHVNAGAVIAWSTNTSTSLLDAALNIPANTLRSRKVINIEAFGSFSDPTASGPNVTFTLSLGGTTIVTQSKPVASGNWRLGALITVRSGGAVVGAIAIDQDSGTENVFPFSTQTATIDPTLTLNFDLTATIQDFTTAEAVICEQLLVKLE